MFAKETYTTRRNSLKKRGDRFLAILDTWTRWKNWGTRIIMRF